jgi:hypothetical protein
MHNRNIFRRSLDNVRTAPFGLSLIGGGAIGPLVELVHNGPEVTDLSSAPVPLITMAYGAAFVARQFKLRRRLEATVEQHGYDDRVFSTTTSEWCARQTSRVVCRNSGDLIAYTALCKKNEETAQLAWLPHF